MLRPETPNQFAEDDRLNTILTGIYEGANPNGMSDENKAIYAAYLDSLDEDGDAEVAEAPAEVVEREPEPEPEVEELTPAQKAVRTRAANKAKREAEAALEAAIQAGD